jgi:uncharacterized metal-binding protein
LASHGFLPVSSEAQCIYKHVTKDIIFCLVVDDFGVKYQRDADVHNLLEVLRLEYVVKDDWSGCSYVGDAAERFGIDTSKKIDNPLGASTIGKAAPATPQQQKRPSRRIRPLRHW